MSNTLPFTQMAYARKSVAKAAKFLQIRWNAMMEIILMEMDAVKIAVWKRTMSALVEAQYLPIAA